MKLVTASDGLPARKVHTGSDEKLFYIERYMDIFTVGMKNKWRLVYGDLFCGPGLCVEKKTGRESRGSPLRALDRGFERHFWNDQSPEVIAALRARTPEDVNSAVTLSQRDCNDAVDAAIETLFPPGTENGTLGVVVIDPTAFQMTFSALERLTAGRRVDVIITVMTSLIRRWGHNAPMASTIDAFMGTDEWRKHESSRGWLDVYKQQLRLIGYGHVDDDSRILNAKNSTIYHLVFASKSPRGADFFYKISQKNYWGQGRLL